MNRRFALIQAAISLVALAAVVLWATGQDPPEFPSGNDALAWLAGALALYAVATLIRGERWHRILEISGVKAGRADCYALTTVGYMGNNVLPARAGEVLRVVMLSPRCGASKRTVGGSIVAERLLDVVALAVIFLATVYGVLSASALPTTHPRLMAVIIVAIVLALAGVIWILRSHHVFERVRDWLRPLADSPRALLSRAGAVLLVVTFVLWSVEAGVYLAVARSVDLDIGMSGALYLVALTNFVSALPAAPGSIGTFDAAVAWGVERLARGSGKAVSYLLILRFILYVPITLVGFVVLVTRYGGWARLRDALRAAKTAEEVESEVLTGKPAPHGRGSHQTAPAPSRAEAPTA